VDIDDAEGMAERLLQLYQNPEIREGIGQRALEMVKPFLLQNAGAEII